MDITKFIDENGEEHAYKDENAVHKSDIAQALGTDPDKPISQKAVTEALAGAGGGGGGVVIEGKDGFSPIVELSKTGKVTTLKITDANGTKTATINDGADGKNAYEYAKEGGYTGTEEEFKRKLASEFAPARIGEVTLASAGWIGAASPYSQVVSIDGVTANSQVDLTPSVEQLAIFHEKDLAFVTENEDGVVTVYAIGQKPENDYTIQVTITEVAI